MAEQNNNAWGAWQSRHLTDNAGDTSLQQQQQVPNDLNDFSLRRQAYVDRERKRSEEVVQAMGNHPSYLAYALEAAHKQNAAQATHGTQGVQGTEAVNNTTYTTAGKPWSPHRLGRTQENNTSDAETDGNNDFQNVREQYAHWPTMIGNDKMAYLSIERLLQEQEQLRHQERQNTTEPWLAHRQPLAQATPSHMHMPSSAITRMPTTTDNRFFDPEFGRNNNNNNAGSDKVNTVPKLAPEIRPRIDTTMAALRAPLQQWPDSKVAHSSSHLDSMRNGTARKTPTATTYGDDATTPKATQRPSSISPWWTLPYGVGNGTTSNGTSNNNRTSHTRVPSPNEEPPHLSLKSLVLDSLDNVESREENTLHSDNNNGNNSLKEESHGARSGPRFTVPAVTAISTAAAAVLTTVPTKAVDTQATLTPLGPSAPGFFPPKTGYEFELNHCGNRLELCRQKKWAQTQLSSCNENNRFKHTQTTACIVAVNGRIIGPYRAESLWCFGTNPEIAGLRVTMAVCEGETSEMGKHSSSADGDDKEDSAMPVFRHATLVLRYQIIVTHPARNYHHQHQQRQEFPPYMLPHSSSTTSISSLMTSLSRLSGGDSASASSASNRTRTNTEHSTASSSIGGGTASTAASTTHRYSMSSTMSGASAISSSHHQGRRYLFATTTIPLHAGVAARPGYRPVEASAAAERIRQWGGQPDKGVFGNSWLVHMAIEPGHVQHNVDTKMMEQVQRLTGHRSGGGGSDFSGGGGGGGSTDAPIGGATAVQTMRMVNEHMAKLVAREGTLSVMLSNHTTQKRIARQCPDLVAMWVMAQENL